MDECEKRFVTLYAPPFLFLKKKNCARLKKMMQISFYKVGYPIGSEYKVLCP